MDTNNSNNVMNDPSGGGGGGGNQYYNLSTTPRSVDRTYSTSTDTVHHNPDGTTTTAVSTPRMSSSMMIHHQQIPMSPNSTNPTPKQGNRLTIPSNDIVSLFEPSNSYNIVNNTTNDNQQQKQQQQQQQQQYSGRKLQLPVLDTRANTATENSNDNNNNNQRPNHDNSRTNNGGGAVSVSADEEDIMLSRRMMLSTSPHLYSSNIGGLRSHHAHTIGSSTASSYTGLWNTTYSQRNIGTDPSVNYNTTTTNNNNSHHPVIRLNNNTYHNTTTGNNNNNNPNSGRIRPRMQSPKRQQPPSNNSINNIPTTNLRQFFLPTAPFIAAAASQNPTGSSTTRVYEYHPHQHQQQQYYPKQVDTSDSASSNSRRTNPITIHSTEPIPGIGTIPSSRSIGVIQSQVQPLPEPEPIQLPRNVPLKPIQQCPLFACFYAEFDIIVGPKIINEFPIGFMEQDIRIGTNQIEILLQQTIQSIIDTQQQRKQQENEKLQKQEQEEMKKRQQNPSEKDESKKTSEISNSQNTDNSNLDSTEIRTDDKINNSSSKKDLVVPDLVDAPIRSTNETSTTTSPNTEPQVESPTKSILSVPNLENDAEGRTSVTGTPVIQPKTPIPVGAENNNNNTTNSSDTAHVLSPPQLLTPNVKVPASSPRIVPRGIPPSTKRDSTVVSTSSTNNSTTQNASNTTDAVSDTGTTANSNTSTNTTSTRRGPRHKKTLSATDTILEQLKNSSTSTSSTIRKSSDGTKSASNSNHQQQLNNSGASINGGSSNHHNNTNVHSNDGHQSIFDSCSEYIITGNELSENIVNLSTHNIHVLTRPTSIHDVKYERNCLSFCVGFILRRSTDSRPFRTVLSKLALLLRDMEIENQFLTKSKQSATNSSTTTITTTSTQQSTTSSTNTDTNHTWTWTQKPSNVQELLEQVFLALNSHQGECNLVLHCGASSINCNTNINVPNPLGRVNSNVNSNSTPGGTTGSNNKSIGDNVLNLKLFHPPRILAEPVKDYAVPILLRRDWQLQAYDWDLSINWVSLHIDGVINARQISQRAEVDMEMVRACLRVLKHHGVIAFVDMFFYSNRYESTEKAATLLNGTNEKLLHEAVRFVYKGGPNKANYQQHQTQQTSPMIHASTSPILTMSLMHNVALAHHYNHGSSPSTPILYDGNSNHEQNQPGSDSNNTTNNGTNAQLSSSFRTNNHLSASQQSNREISELAKVRKDYNEVKFAIAELYCACNRGLSIGDLLLALIASNAEKVRTNHVKMTAITNWKKVFRLIDHRRFTTFGQVHGLLNRVHNYPLLVDTDVPDDVQLRDPQDDVMTNQPFSLSRANSLILDKNLARKQHRTGRSGKNSRSLSSGTNTINNEYRYYREKEESRALTAQITEWMDGTHCDDELVCVFQKPLSRLFEVVSDKNNYNNNNNKKKHIVSLYATAT